MKELEWKKQNFGRKIKQDYEKTTTYITLLAYDWVWAEWRMCKASKIW